MAHWTDCFTTVDTETTGFRTSDRVIEIAFVHFKDRKVVDSYTTRINPGFSVPPEASQIHGITDEDLHTAPRFDDVIVDIASWLGDYDQGPLIAHGLHFDMRLLGYSFSQPLDYDRPAACSVDFSKYNHPELRIRKKGHKVTDLIEYFEIDMDVRKAHGALFDATATGMFVPKLFEGFDESCLRPLSAFMGRR